MFEFHGWAVVQVLDREDTPESDKLAQGREREALRIIQGLIPDALDIFGSVIRLRRTSNQMHVIYAHGLRNHRQEPVIELFRRVATEFPDSYGLLYIHDDEDHTRGGDYQNEFRVWKLAKGRFEESADPFLSPYIPGVE